MKKIRLILASALLAAAGRAQAQMPFAAMDSININNINALQLVHGDMWWNPGPGVAHCYFPAASGKSINFAGALWMSGYDGSGQLHVAAQTYRQDGNDYWPGPLDAADTLIYATSQKWARIWKLNRTSIDTFLGLATHTTANTPATILTWPAKGNAYAQGAAGAPLTIATDMAPFIDLNSNGIYEPLSGEYPDIKGDQALWWVFGDNGPVHNCSNGRPLGVEVQAMAYAYNRGTLIDNVIYYDYKVINRSTNNYSSFRLGEWDDIDLGYYLDDYIGFDSLHRMGISYNGTTSDGISAGSPANSYGALMPVVGLSIVVMPGDDLTTHSRVPAGSFMYYNNDVSAYGNPSVDTQYNNYLRSKFRNGDHVTNDFAGAGTPTFGYGSGPLSNFVFTGDPAIPTQWSECISGNIPGDRRFIITSNDFTLSAGATQHVVMALVTTNLDTANGCPSQGFTGIKNIADTAWNIYEHPLPGRVAVADVHSAAAITIYPNPAHDKLYVEDHSNGSGAISLAIYNTIGQQMQVAAQQGGDEIDISSFPAGIYHVVYSRGDARKSATIVKQ